MSKTIETDITLIREWSKLTEQYWNVRSHRSCPVDCFVRSITYGTVRYSHRDLECQEECPGNMSYRLREWAAFLGLRWVGLATHKSFPDPDVMCEIWSLSVLSWVDFPSKILRLMFFKKGISLRKETSSSQARSQKYIHTALRDILHKRLRNILTYLFICTMTGKQTED